MNKLFELTWSDPEGNEYKDWFPSREEAEDHVEFLREETAVIGYGIEEIENG